MLSYIARRLALMVPTLFGILLVSFVIVQFAPGGPVERVITLETGMAGREANMRAFAAALFRLAAEVLE